MFDFERDLRSYGVIEFLAGERFFYVVWTWSKGNDDVLCAPQIH